MLFSILPIIMNKEVYIYRVHYGAPYDAIPGYSLVGRGGTSPFLFSYVRITCTYGITYLQLPYKGMYI
jgi:hypothetical protein